MFKTLALASYFLSVPTTLLAPAVCIGGPAVDASQVEKLAAHSHNRPSVRQAPFPSDVRLACDASGVKAGFGCLARQPFSAPAGLSLSGVTPIRVASR